MVAPACPVVSWHRAVPPFAVRVMVPLLPLPLQLTFKLVAVVALNAVNGWVIVADAVVVQPLLSVTVVLYKAIGA